MNIFIKNYQHKFNTNSINLMKFSQILPELPTQIKHKLNTHSNIIYFIVIKFVISIITKKYIYSINIMPIIIKI